MVIDSLIQTVQRNCDIADAQHGTDYSMCTYLMKMREYFRWQQGYGFSDRLPKEELGNWLSEREEALAELESAAFAPLQIADKHFDPFDTDAINAQLAEMKLVYSAGLENSAKPHFYLAQLESVQQPLAGFSIAISGQELARGLNSPPAMLRENTIFLRREALRRLLWERLETWRWNRLDNAMGRAFAAYDTEHNLDVALAQMADDELETLRQHEIGEYQAGQLLGERWNQILLRVAATPAELMMRALRDHLADCYCTIPYLIDNGRASSLHFYIGNLSGMRAQLFPALKSAYEQWRSSGSTTALVTLAEQGADTWAALATAVVQLDSDETNLPVKIQALVQADQQAA